MGLRGSGAVDGGGDDREIDCPNRRQRGHGAPATASPANALCENAGDPLRRDDSAWLKTGHKTVTGEASSKRSSYLLPPLYTPVFARHSLTESAPAMGWRKCQYPHQEHMPFAREPLKSLYVTQRLLTTLALVPCWAIYYALLPRDRRPRRSWSLKQIISVNFTRRVYKVTELAGVTWGTRDPTAPVDNRHLRETRFEWAEPLPEDYRTGVLVDEHVPFLRVGMFVWPKLPPPCTGKCTPSPRDLCTAKLIRPE